MGYNQYPMPFTGGTFPQLAGMSGMGGGSPTQPMAPPFAQGAYAPGQMGPYPPYLQDPNNPQTHGVPPYPQPGTPYWNRLQHFNFQQWQAGALDELYPANDSEFNGQLTDQGWASAPIPGLTSKYCLNTQSRVDSWVLIYNIMKVPRTRQDMKSMALVSFRLRSTPTMQRRYLSQLL